MFAKKLLGNKKGVSSIFIAIYVTLIIATLLSVLFFGLSITHSSMINYMQNDQDRNQETIIIRGPGALNVSSTGLIQSLLVNNTGPITVRIRAIYIGGIFVWDPSKFSGDSYIPAQSSLRIELTNPTLYMDNTLLHSNWTVATERGTKASETGQNLWLGSQITQYESNKFYFGPLLLIFNMFHWSTNGGTTWNSGWTIPQDAKNVIWRILAADIDQRQIALNTGSTFALVQNSQQQQKIASWKIGPANFNPPGLTLDPGYYYFLYFSVEAQSQIGYMSVPIPITSNFITILGNFVELDGSLNGFAQTIPFEAVKITGLPEINTYTTLNTLSSTQTVGTPVAVSGTVTVNPGDASVPSNSVVMIEYSEVNSEEWVNILSPTILTSAGTYTGTFSPPHAGTYEFRAMFIGATQGQTAWAPSASTSQIITVQKATSTTTMQTPSPITLGQSVSARATVNPSFATGTVTFEVSTDNGATYTFLSTNPVSAGSAASNQYTPSAPGSNYRFRATYNGDADVLSSPTSAPVTLTVNKANPTVTTPTLNPPSPITLGNSVTATITVAGVAGITPTGTVTFQYSTDSGSTWNTLSTQTLASGSATSDPYLPTIVGNFYRIRALYSGDTNYNSATSNSATLSVKTASSITVALTPASPITLGTQVRVTATVSGGYGTPTGNVDFYVSTNGGLTFTKIGATKTLSGGSATSDPYTPPYLGSPYQFKAIYAGDTIYFSQESTTIPLTVTSATSITLSSSTITIGQSITATATINPLNATGTVTFEYSIDGGSTFSPLGAPQTLVAGSAVSGLYTPPAPGSSYRFRAIYSGDANVLGSQSTQTTLTVLEATPTITPPTLNTSSPVALGDSAEASVTVTGLAGIDPTGDVTFQFSTDNGASWNTFSTQTLTSGSATSDPYTPEIVGSYLLRAVYSGDTNYDSVTSDSTSLNVKVEPSITATLLPPDPVSLGTAINITVTVSGDYGTPIGNVDFLVSTDDGTTFTQFSTMPLVGGAATSDYYTPPSAGTYVFEASYGGDTSYFDKDSSQIFLTLL